MKRTRSPPTRFHASAKFLASESAAGPHPRLSLRARRCGRSGRAALPEALPGALALVGDRFAA